MDTMRIENITSSQVSHAEKEMDEELEREARMAGDLPSLEGVASAKTNETFISGVEKSKHTSAKVFAGRDGTDKAMTAGRRGSEIGEVRARHVSCTKNKTPLDVAAGSTAEPLLQAVTEALGQLRRLVGGLQRGMDTGYPTDPIQAKGP